MPPVFHKEIDNQDLISKSQCIKPPKSWKKPDIHSAVALEHPWYSHVFQIQNTLYHSTVEYFNRIKKYSYILTPLTTDTISSPMGLGSDSEPVQIRLFDNKIYLADSMQFTLEYFLRLQNNLKGTYYISPSFRGEDPDATHLNQFFHAECELIGDMNDGIKIAEEYIYFLSKSILDEHKEFILNTSGTIGHIESLLKNFEKQNCFPRITFEEAFDLLSEEKCFELIDEKIPELGYKITRKGEQKLIDIHKGPVWLTEMDHIAVPFYQAYITGTNKAKAADLLIGMGETLGLGERHRTADEVNNALNQHKLSEESYEWYINMRKIKPLKTTGWGMGIERFLCWILNHNDVRDMHIIPRLKNQVFQP